MNLGQLHVSLPAASAFSEGIPARTTASRIATPTEILAVPSAAFPARKARNRMTLVPHASEDATLSKPIRR